EPCGATTRQAALRRLNLNRARPVIRPKRAVSTADRAIATGHRAGRSPHTNADRPAVTGCAGYGLRGSGHSITSKGLTRRSYSIIIPATSAGTTAPSAAGP